MSDAHSAASATTVTYRLTEERDVSTILEMYALLNNHFYSTGYRLPSPENVAEIWWDTFKRTLGRFSNSWVSEVDSLLAGFITCRVKRVPAYMGGVLVGELSDMWIIPQARRLHIGDHLSRLALEWLRQQGVHSVEIQVLNSNEASWNLFQRMGFQLEFRLARLLWDEYQPEGGEEHRGQQSAPPPPSGGGSGWGSGVSRGEDHCP